MNSSGSTLNSLQYCGICAKFSRIAPRPRTTTPAAAERQAVRRLPLSVFSEMLADALQVAALDGCAERAAGGG